MNTMTDATMTDATMTDATTTDATTKKKKEKIWSTIRYVNGTATIKSVDLNLYFTKDADRLDFTVRVLNENGQKCSIDGFVARVLGSNRYYVNSEVLPIDFCPDEFDEVGKGAVRYMEWKQTDGHYTMIGAIKHHLERIWGITVSDEIMMPAVLPTSVRQEAERKVFAIAMASDYSGNSHKTVARKFAKEVVASGSCFSAKGWDYPRTTPIALFNFNGYGVAEQWKVMVDNEDSEVA